jgi:hypothetical protein
MRFAAIVVSIAIVTALPASAQNKPAKAPEPKAVVEPRKQDCSEYGAGFVRVNGTGSCVKIGGYVRGQGAAR